MPNDASIPADLVTLLPIIGPFADTRGLDIFVALQNDRHELLCEWPDPTIRKLIHIHRDDTDLIVSVAADESRVLGRVEDPNEQQFYEDVGRVEIPPDKAVSDPFDEAQTTCLLALLQQAWHRLDSFGPDDLARESSAKRMFVEDRVDPVLDEFAAASNAEVAKGVWYEREISWPRTAPRFHLTLWLDPLGSVRAVGAYAQRRGLLKRLTWLACPEVGPNLISDWSDAASLRQGLVEAQAQLERYASVQDPWDNVRGMIPDETWLRLRRLRSWVVATPVLAGCLYIVAIIALNVLGWNSPPSTSAYPRVGLLLTAILAYAGRRMLFKHLGQVTENILRQQASSPMVAKRVRIALWAKYYPTLLDHQRADILDRAQFQRQKAAGPRLWHTELSGLHVIIWLGLFLSVLLGSTWRLLPDSVTLPVLIPAVILSMMKAGYWVFWLLATPATRMSLMRGYRWCGTLKGTLILGIGVPGAVIGIFLLVIWMVDTLNAR